MALHDGRKLSKEEVEKEGLPARGRGNLGEYERVFGDLDSGEGYRYAIGLDAKAITERSRWAAVASRHGFKLVFKSRKDRSTGETTIEVVKGDHSGTRGSEATSRGRRGA